MFQVQNVTKWYGKVVANSEVSFDVDAGEIAVLIGPNGAGKSTIIKCITGLLRYQGQVTIGGYDNRSLEAKRLLGYVPEMPAVYPALTVGEHLEFIRRAYRLEDDGYGQQLLNRFELADKVDKLGSELSKGMQQKVSICCALLHRPKAIIFDEPMIGLDPHAIKELIQCFKEMAADGTAVLISTHMLSSVEDYWNAAHIMMNGRIAASIDNQGDGKQSLEKLFFEITEGGAE